MYGAQTLIKDLLQSAAARTIIERHFPGALSHPMLPEVMYMTLGEVASFPEANLAGPRFQVMLEELGNIDQGGAVP